MFKVRAYDSIGQQFVGIPTGRTDAREEAKRLIASGWDRIVVDNLNGDSTVYTWEKGLGWKTTERIYPSVGVGFTDH